MLTMSLAVAAGEQRLEGRSGRIFPFRLRLIPCTRSGDCYIRSHCQTVSHIGTVKMEKEPSPTC